MRSRSRTSPLTPTTGDGVLTLDAVLAEEHDRLYGDDALARVHALPLQFTPEQIVDPHGVAHALLAVCIGEGVALRDPRAPLDSIACFILGGRADAVPSLASALAEYRNAHTGSNTDAYDGHVELADRRFAEAFAARLNELLDKELEREPCFAPYAAKAEIAVVASGAPTRTAVNRMLIESAFPTELQSMRDRRLALVFDAVRSRDAAALCLSGGGLRSATFALGVLRGLAKHRLLTRFDYLSTVSGGGYIGGWLSAWMHREGAAAVQEELGRPGDAKLQPEPKAVRHLRAYARFLTPRSGFLSGDTWTLVATMLRNLLLNWLVLLPLIAAVILVPSFVVAVLRVDFDELPGLSVGAKNTMLTVLLIAGALLVTLAMSFIHANRARTYERSDEASRGDDQRAFLAKCLAPLVAGSAMLSTGWYLFWNWSAEAPGHVNVLGLVISPGLHHRGDGDTALRATLDSVRNHPDAVLAFLAIAIVIHFGGWLFGMRSSRQRGRELAPAIVTGILAGASALLAGMWFISLPETPGRELVYTTLATPVLLGVILGASQFFTGWTSRATGEADREWAARSNAWLLVAMLVWSGCAFVVLYGPGLVDAGVSALTVSGIGGLSTLSTTWLGGRLLQPRNRSRREPSGIAAIADKLVAAVVVPLCMVLVIIALSAFDERVVRLGCDLSPFREMLGCRSASSVFAAPVDPAVPVTVLILFAILCGFSLLMGSRIDTNVFSLHGMYRARLVRAYLGASRPSNARTPDRFTGFDPTDDIPIGHLWPSATSHGFDDVDNSRRRGHSPPLHVVNTTLNLVAGHRLAWQQRQAESMTISPLHAGSAFVGYRRTSRAEPGAPQLSERLYGGPRGTTLGNAMTISGAAASPNAGYHSSPAVTWLMTLFNARLGSWLGNPGPAGEETFYLSAPRQTMRPILSEMFGLTSDRNPYVYLSDGGHFENLGIYEMVLRRCRFIVVSDAGCDPDCTYEDLGNAVRKIRIDLGVPIEFPDGMPIEPRSDTRAESSHSKATYWAIGRIRYSAIDMKDPSANPDDYDGVLVYIKPEVYGREPRDVVQYSQTSPAFPHESTADQFFTESQFESYRALGEFIVDDLVASAPRQSGTTVTSHCSGSLLDRWPSLAATPRAAAPSSAYDAPPRGVRV